MAMSIVVYCKWNGNILNVQIQYDAWYETLNWSLNDVGECDINSYKWCPIFVFT